MSLVELRTYLEWLEKSKVDFNEEMPNPKQGSLAQVELDWYNSEIAKTNNFIKMHEVKRVRDGLNAEARKFLTPTTELPVPNMEPQGFAFLMHKVKVFNKALWAILSH